MPVPVPVHFFLPFPVPVPVSFGSGFGSGSGYGSGPFSRKRPAGQGSLLVVPPRGSGGMVWGTVQGLEFMHCKKRSFRRLRPILPCKNDKIHQSSAF